MALGGLGTREPGSGRIGQRPAQQPVTPPVTDVGVTKPVPNKNKNKGRQPDPSIINVAPAGPRALGPVPGNTTSPVGPWRDGNEVGNPIVPTKPGSGGNKGMANQAPDPTKDKMPPMFARMVGKGGVTEAMARQKWARSLQVRGKIGGTPKNPTPLGTKPTGPAGPVAPKPATPAPTPQPGTGGGPAGPSPLPPPGQSVMPMPPPGQNPYPSQQGPPMGGMPGGYGQPYAGPGSPLNPASMGGDFRDPMQSLLAAVPIINANSQKAINDAVSSAGFNGTRWSTSTANDVARIGAEAGAQTNAMMAGLLSDYSNNQENRALQAGQLGLQAGGMFDQMAQDRFMLPAQLGQWEQGRQDDFSKMAYQDFEANKLGYLPMLLNAAQSQGAGSPGQIYSTQSAPQAGLSDWVTLLQGFL